MKRWYAIIEQHNKYDKHFLLSLMPFPPFDALTELYFCGLTGSLCSCAIGWDFPFRWFRFACAGCCDFGCCCSSFVTSFDWVSCWLGVAFWGFAGGCCSWAIVWGCSDLFCSWGIVWDCGGFCCFEEGCFWSCSILVWDWLILVPDSCCPSWSSSGSSNCLLWVSPLGTGFWAGSVALLPLKENQNIFNIYSKNSLTSQERCAEMFEFLSIQIIEMQNAYDIK